MIFRGVWKKQTCLLTFIVHTVRLGDHVEDPFKIEWQRGHSQGCTDQKYANDQGEILFEKRFCCNLTMYINSKDNSMRSKHLAISLVRYQQGITRKVYGKLNLDLVSFLSSSASLTSMFQLESPHLKKSCILMTIKIRQKDSSVRASRNTFTELELTELSENVGLTAESEEDWDVSVALSPQNRQCAEAMQQMGMNIDETEHLSSYMKEEIPQPQSSHIRSRSTIDNNFDLIPNLTSLDAQKMKTFFAPNREPGRPRLSQQAIINFFKSVLSNHWEMGQLESDKLPKSASILYAALMYSQVLDSKSYAITFFDDFMKKFFLQYKATPFIEGYCLFDLFYVSIYLIALIHNEKKFDKQRLTIFENQLLKVAEDQADEYINSAIIEFDPIGKSLFTLQKFETDKTITNFTIEFKKLSASFDRYPENIKNFLINRFVHLFDAKMLDGIFKSSYVCTFTRAIEWSSFATRLSAEISIELSNLKEAAAVFQMSERICKNPKSISEICPSFSPNIVLTLLREQQPDEFMPTENDCPEFIEYYGSDITLNDFDPPSCSQELLELASTLQISEWNNFSFRMQTKRMFPFLGNYFTID